MHALLFTLAALLSAQVEGPPPYTTDFTPGPVLYAPFDSYGARIPDDAETVAHYVWRGGALTDVTPSQNVNYLRIGGYPTNPSAATTPPWSLSSSAITPNFAVAPDGTQTASQVVFNLGSSQVYTGNSTNIPAGTLVNVSAWMWTPSGTLQTYLSATNTVSWAQPNTSIRYTLTTTPQQFSFQHTVDTNGKIGIVIGGSGSQGPMPAGGTAYVWHVEVTPVTPTAQPWTMVGAVPQINDSPVFPYGFATSPANQRRGAGPFSDANYYSLGTGSDVFDFTGDFTVCVMFTPRASNSGVLVSNGVAAQAGWSIQLSGTTGRMNLYRSGGSVNAATTNTVALGSANILCGGRRDTNAVAKLNLGATAVVGGDTPTPGTAYPAMIGRYNGAGALNPDSGGVFEVWVSSARPDEAALIALQQNAVAAVEAGSERVFPDDATTVSHVYWSGLATLNDVEGNAWAQNGTVPQVTSPAYTTGLFAPSMKGAGPFSDANYYGLGSGIDILDFAGDFSVCVSFIPATLHTGVLVGNGVSPTGGWILNIESGGGAVTHNYTGGADVAARTVYTYTPGGLNIICGGRGGGNVATKLNLGAYTSAAQGAIAPGVAYIAKIGRYEGAAAAFNGTILEVWASTASASDALFTAIQRKVLGHVLPTGQTLAVTRASLAQSVYINGKVWYVPAGLARIEPKGLLAEPTRTNVMPRSQSMCSASAPVVPWAVIPAPVTSCGATLVAAPDGTTSAASITTAAMTTRSGIYQDAPIASTTLITGSAWVWTASGTQPVTLGLRNGANTACTCATSDGSPCTAATGTACYAGDAGNTCCAKFVATTTPTRVFVSETLSAAATSTQLMLSSAQGSTTGGTAIWWGAQQETGLYGTSYIQTAASALARNVDIVSTTNPYGPTRPNFCIGAQATPVPGKQWFPDTGTQTLLTAGAFAGPNSWTLQLSGGANLIWQVFNGAGTGKSLTLAQTFPAGSTQQVNASDRNGTLALFANGAQGGTPGGAGTGILAASATPLYFGVDSAGTRAWGGNLRDVRLYDQGSCAGGNVATSGP